MQPPSLDQLEYIGLMQCVDGEVCFRFNRPKQFFKKDTAQQPKL